MGEQSRMTKTELERAIDMKAAQEVRDAWDQLRRELGRALQRFYANCGVNDYPSDHLRPVDTNRAKRVDALIRAWREAQSNPFGVDGPMQTFVAARRSKVVAEVLEATEAIRQLEASVEEMESGQ